MILYYYYFNLYKSCSLAQMVAWGHHLYERKPEYPVKTHAVKQVTNWPSNIQHRGI